MPRFEQFDEFAQHPIPVLHEAGREAAPDHGLLTKSAIHPSQIAVIQDAYRPSATELAEARNILDPATPAVFGSQGMCEPATDARWTASIVARARTYGVRDQARDPGARVV